MCILLCIIVMRTIWGGLCRFPDPQLEAAALAVDVESLLFDPLNRTATLFCRRAREHYGLPRSSKLLLRELCYVRASLVAIFAGSLGGGRASLEEILNHGVRHS